MENKELVVPLPRRMAKYTKVCYRDVPISEGKSFSARIEVNITCPHDAVLETSISRLQVVATERHPEYAALAQSKPGRTANVEVPVA